MRKDFDQNGNGAISWAEFQLALADERMHAFLNALELDMSDAVKIFQILASEKTGAIEESDFLLGCLRLRGGATAVDMVRMQMPGFRSRPFALFQSMFFSFLGQFAEEKMQQDSKG